MNTKTHNDALRAVRDYLMSHGWTRHDLATPDGEVNSDEYEHTNADGTRIVCVGQTDEESVWVEVDESDSGSVLLAPFESGFIDPDCEPNRQRDLAWAVFVPVPDAYVQDIAVYLPSTIDD